MIIPLHLFTEMEDEKYLTEQERVDNMTMKIDVVSFSEFPFSTRFFLQNDNLRGSGFIRHPPQERKPQRNFNVKTPNKRHSSRLRI